MIFVKRFYNLLLVSISIVIIKMKNEFNVLKDSVKVTHVSCIAFSGIDAINVDVQVHISNGLPCFNIVGLPDKIVGESKERIKAALSAIGIILPPKRITINL